MRYSRSKCAGLVVLVGMMSVMLSGNSASAALLVDFEPPGTKPDFKATISSISYDASTDTFSVIGTPEKLILPDLSEYDDFAASSPTFKIEAIITSAGTIGLGTSELQISGKSPSLGNPTTNLLHGVLEKFGFEQGVPGAGEFQFVFGTLTGDLGPYYANGKAYSLVLAFDSSTTFNGTFPESVGFSFGGDSLSADTYGVPVPEPAGATLIGLAFAALLAVGRVKRC